MHSTHILDRIIRHVAPRGPVDLVVKTVLLLLVIGFLNFVRDQIQHPDNKDTFISNTLEASFVGLPFCVLAMVLFWRLKGMQDELIALASTDMLTGLNNRRAFIAQVETRLPAKGGVLLMIDADHFKLVNDTFGHATGDLCLQRIADHLRAKVRNGDILARMGGEEFAVLLAGADMETARQIGGRLAAGVALPAETAMKPTHVTLSVGAAPLATYANLEDGLRAADLALYEAKKNGRARMETAENDASPAPAPAAA